MIHDNYPNNGLKLTQHDIGEIAKNDKSGGILISLNVQQMQIFQPNASQKHEYI